MPGCVEGRMNFFPLHQDPVKAAIMHADRDIVYQPHELAQLLAMACLLRGVKKVPYKLTHKNAPTVLWLLESADNYCWLWEHFTAMLLEYNNRYDKNYILLNTGIHDFFYQNPPPLKERGLTPFPTFFRTHTKYGKIEDGIEAARRYYIEKKIQEDPIKWTWKDGRPELWDRYIDG